MKVLRVASALRERRERILRISDMHADAEALNATMTTLQQEILRITYGEDADVDAIMQDSAVRDANASLEKQFGKALVLNDNGLQRLGFKKLDKPPDYVPK